MTTSELSALIGKTRLLQVSSQDKQESIHVPVKVLDSKMAYGKVHLVVEPIGGTGTMTVVLGRTKEV